MENTLMTFKQKDKIINDILKTTLSIEQIANAFYFQLAESTCDASMHDFWLKMAGEEQTHILFWEKALKLAEEEKIPQIFDAPEKILNELNVLLSTLTNLFDSITECTIDSKKALLLSFKIEFYNIHIGLAPLFNVIKRISGDKSTPYDHYDKHLAHFTDKYKELFEEENPEISLLGEVIQKLWNDNVKLSINSNTDELTGLLTRRGFSNIILPLINLAKRKLLPVAFIIADIDHFKKINDQFGHPTGDIVLKGIAASIKSCLRDADIVGRYGGEEFIIFCPDIEANSITSILRKIRETVNEASFAGHNVTISMGGVECILSSTGKEIKTTLSEIYKEADMLLYEAKNTGRDKYIHKRLLM